MLSVIGDNFGKARNTTIAGLEHSEGRHFAQFSHASIRGFHIGRLQRADEGFVTNRLCVYIALASPT